MLNYDIRSAGWAMVLAVGSVAVGSMAGAPLPSDSCLYALSSNGSRAFQVAGGSFTTGCSIAVASTNNEAFQMEGQVTLNLNHRAQVAVVGGSALNGNTLRDTVLNQNVSPISITTPADPLASLVAPTTGTIVRASATNYDNNNPPPGNAMSPGVYCAGLRIGNTNNVTYTMSPGVYVMAGGGFRVESQGRVSGTGVTIYTTTGSGWGCGANGNAPYAPILLTGQANVNLKAPTTGSLAGVLWMGSRTACATVGGCEHRIEANNTTATLNGALYFPRDAFRVTGQATVTGRVMLVANTAVFQVANWNTGLNPYIPVTLSVTPGTATLAGGQTQQFAATVENTNQTAVTWTVVSGGGSISAAGLYTAPAVGAPTTVTVRATSVADVSKSATATVTVNPVAAVSVSVTPGTATVYGGQAQQFTTTVTNAANTAVTWSVTGAGTVSAAGLYTAPASVAVQATVTVTATSVADATKSASAVVTLRPPVTVTVGPATATLYGAQTQQFTATVANAANTAVTWSVSGGGSISSAGLYTAPVAVTAVTMVTVTGTSVADVSKSATATITLNPPVTVSVTPTTATLGNGQTQQFSAVVTNAANTAVTWLVSGGGTIDANGLYTAPASIAAPVAATVTATSVADGTKSTTATVNLSAVTVTMTPTTASMTAGQTQQFTATIAGVANQAVTWSVTGGGTISATGLYTAPACVTTNQTVTVRATSVADPSKSATAAVTLPVSGTHTAKRAVVINKTKVAADLTNFPVAVQFTDSALKTVANGGKVISPNGFDLVFSSDAQCSVKLDYEIELWNGATGAMTAWVRLPAVSAATDTVFYLCYGNAAVTTDQSNKVGVWGASHTGVWHLPNGTVLSAADSTGVNHGTLGPATVATAGKWNGGAGFNGTQNAYVLLPQAAFGYPVSGRVTTYGLTFETWFKSAGTAVILGQWGGTALPGGGANGWVPALYLDNAGLLRASMFLHGSGSGDQIVSAKSYADNQWHYVANTYNNGTETLYVDGVVVASRTGNVQDAYAAEYRYALGAGVTSSWPGGNGGWLYLNGQLDEAKVSNVARPAEWIVTSYNNLNAPGAFLTVYPENVAVVVSPLTAALYAGQTQQFAALATACAVGGVNWTLTPAGAGTLSASGLFEAPLAIAAAQTVTIAAASMADNSAVGTATVTLYPPVFVSVTPANGSVAMGQLIGLTATVQNAVDTSVRWSIFPLLGTIDASTGVYTAPGSVAGQTQVRVTATSVVDPSKSATVTLLVGPLAGAVVLSPGAGNYGGAQLVAMTTATPGASIRYTTDGSTPTATQGTLYTTPITVSSAVTVRAIAFGVGITDSAVTAASYTFTVGTATARYLFADRQTQGNWPGVYGQNGYNVLDGTRAYPAYANVSWFADRVESFSPTTDVRALLAATTGTARVAATLYSANRVEVNLTDGLPHQVTIYMLDYFRQGGVQTVTVLDTVSGAVLDTRTASNLGEGQYFSWTMSGRVSIQLTIQGGNNVLFSGIFFDPPGVNVSPRTARLAAGATQLLLASVGLANPSVVWNVSGLGTVSAAGNYTAPATVLTQQTVTVTATSMVDGSKSGSAVLTLLAGTTGGAMGDVTNLIAEALCRQPHAAPLVDAGADQFVACTGNCAAAATVTGRAAEFVLQPGATLAYGWSLLSEPAPVTFAAATSASSGVTFTQPGSYRLQLSINDGLVTSSGLTTVVVNPAGSGSGFFSLTPGLSGPNAVGSSVNLTARLWGTQFGLAAGPLPGYPVTLTVSGANARVVNLVTDSNGDVSYSFTGINAGTDTVVATANGGTFGNFTANNSTITWTAATPGLTMSAVTGTFYAGDGTGVFNTAITATPAFTQTFPGLLFNTAAVVGSPVSDLTRPFTNLMVNRTGAFLGTIPAESPTGYEAGVGPLYNFNAVFTGVLSVPSAGQRVFTITSDDGFVLGISGATRVSGPVTGTPATTTFRGYPVMGGVNLRQAPLAQTITVNFPAAGNYPYELNFAKGGDARVTLTMLADGAPIPAAALLTLTPARVPSTTAGAIATFHLSALDAGGFALSNLPVTFSVAGQNEQIRTTTTDGVGAAGVAYTGSPLRIGRDTIQAAARVAGLDVYSNVVTVQWNTGTNQGPMVSAGSNLPVEMPRLAVLAGAVSDDGLPLAPGFMTIGWAMMSGPASVVFDNAAQASTAAAFSVPGTYVLRLTASDGQLSAFSDVTVTVTAPAGTWSSGWIASPVDLSQVTGQVPITLIPGITLTSGTLLLRSVSDPANPVVLSASTTGAGQIGLLDATMLRNGSYFIELAATNTAALTQNNLVLVKVQGDVKLGRVLATTTDLTVPAPGLAIKIQRTYDSLNRNRRGDFGFGWDLGVKVQLEVSPTNDVTLTMGGRRRTFYFTPQPNAVFVSYYTPQWTGERGFYGKLESLGDNCTGVLVRVLNVYQCALNNAGNAYVTTGYRYTDPVGTVYTIGANGLLSSVLDLNGNTLTVTESGISSTSGLSVPFVRDGLGRITSITDSLGKVYRYGYDANGDLVSFEQPLTPVVTTQYTYLAGHYWNSERDPRGGVATTSYYPDGRISSVTSSVGDVTGFAYDQALRRTTVTNPDGGTEVTDLDANGDVVRKADGLGRVMTMAYDLSRNLVSETNGLGLTKQYTYDANGFRTSVRDPLGNTTTTAYNSVGGPTSILNPLNQLTSISYDANFNIATMTDLVGSIAQFTYNAQGLPTTMRDARSSLSSYLYDASGNRTSLTDQLNRVTTSAYDTLGRKTGETNPRGFATTMAYDALGRETSMTDALAGVAAMEFDGNGNKTADVDKLGRRTTYLYDAEDRQTRVTYSDLTTKQFTYDFRKKVLTETDQLGRVTRFTYDRAGQLIGTTYALGTADEATGSTAYDAAGRKISETNARGGVTQYIYDTADRMLSMTDPVGNVTQYGYDAAGRRTSRTDAKNRVTSYTYDARGRQLTATYADGRVTSKTYDGMGSVVSQTDEDGKVTTFGYDAAGQLAQVTNALGQVTRYGYDGAGNKISQTDARNSITTYQWDALNRRTRRTLPLGQFETYGYDAVGNQTARTDFNGKTTAFFYDSLNRQLRRTPDASFAAPPVQYTYTATGKRLSMNDVTGATTYSYDNRDRLLMKATPQGSLTYTHDRNSMVASVLSSNTGGVSVSYAYDLANRLTTVTDNFAGGGASTYTYEATNVPQRVAYPNGMRHMFGYDQRDRQTSVSVENGAAVLASWAYTYGLAGHRLTSKENSGRAVGYSYDNAYKLVSESIAGDPAGNGLLSYSHDAVGNRLSLVSSLLALASQTKSYDTNDRMTDDTYDANGNTLLAGGSSYAYEFEDRLTSATKAGVTVAMQYDGDGNRIVRTEGGSTVRYLVDDLTPTGYAQVAEEVVAGSVARVYAHGSQRVSQRQLVSGTWTFSYYGYDESMGSVRLLADAGGSATDRYAYDGFGNVVARSGSTANAYLYRGEQFDSGLGLYYLRARWYLPESGGFLTQDKFEGPDPIPSGSCAMGQCGCNVSPCCIGVHHLRLFGDANPISKADPSGNSNVIAIGLRAPITWLEAASLFVISAGVVCVLEATSSVLGWEVAGIIGGFDFSLEKTPGFNCFFSANVKTGKWTCQADCNMQHIGTGDTKHSPQRSGSGSSKTEACQAAIRNANAAIPLGWYKRHCDCFDCVKR